MSAAAVLTVAGLLMDAAIGGIAVMDAFAKFREARPADETEEQAKQAFVKEMLEQLVGEQEADDAVDAWMAKHGGG